MYDGMIFKERKFFIKNRKSEKAMFKGGNKLWGQEGGYRRQSMMINLNVYRNGQVM